MPINGFTTTQLDERLRDVCCRYLRKIKLKMKFYYYSIYYTTIVYTYEQGGVIPRLKKIFMTPL